MTKYQPVGCYTCTPWGTIVLRCGRTPTVQLYIRRSRPCVTVLTVLRSVATAAGRSWYTTLLQWHSGTRHPNTSTARASGSVQKGCSDTLRSSDAPLPKYVSANGILIHEHVAKRPNPLPFEVVCKVGISRVIRIPVATSKCFHA